MEATFEAAPGITAIDTMMVGHARVTSAYLVRATEPAIVETGPTTSLQAVLDGLAALEVGPDDLAHIVVTHIHLDHAGGAGALAPHFPGAKVWVHERGAPHLADPTKLMSSAARVYGEAELMRMFGPVHPVPGEMLRSVSDGDIIDLGDRSLSVIYTPGHASHQVCFVDSDTGVLFTGDALGVFLPDADVLRPATPPPEFDLEMAVESVRRVQGARPPALLFSHFGPTSRVDELCELAILRLEGWTGMVDDILREIQDLDGVTRELERRTADEMVPAVDRGLDPERLEILSSVRMNAMGIIRYLKKRGQRTD